MQNVVYKRCGCRWPNPNLNEDFFAAPGDELPLGTDVDIHAINLNCPIVWELMEKGVTKGMFQLESSFAKDWTKQVKPKGLEDICALNSLLRPGCVRVLSGTPPKSMAQRYVDRKHGKEIVTYLSEHLRPILEKTYGVLLYQEQAMRIAVDIAGFNEQEADILRKAIGKKKADIMKQVEDGFIKGCEKCGIVTEEEAKEIFSWIRESQRYSFNRSHSMSYGKNAYWSAYCKAHFPIEFFTSYLIGASWKADKYEEMAEVVNDAKLYGADVMLPEFFDLRPYAQIKNRKIYMGMQEIRDIGDSGQTQIFREIKKATALIEKEPKEWTWLEYLVHYSPHVSKTRNEALIYCGALDYFKMSRRAMLFEYTQWNIQVNDTEKTWASENWNPNWVFIVDVVTDCSVPGKFQYQTIDNKKTRVRISGGGASTKKRGAKLEDVVKVLKNPGQDLADTPDFLAWAEEKYFGIALTCSKVDGREEAIQANMTCKEYMDGMESDYIVLAVQINNVIATTTKKGKNPGQKMARVTLSDSSCAIDDAVCFPDAYRKCSEVLYEGNTVLIQGQRTSKGSLAINKVKEI